MGLIHDIVTLVTEPLFTGLNSTFGCASEDPPDVVVCVFFVLMESLTRIGSQTPSCSSCNHAASW